MCVYVYKYIQIDGEMERYIDRQRDKKDREIAIDQCNHTVNLDLGIFFSLSFLYSKSPLAV